jgi:hypothetical protein
MSFTVDTSGLQALRNRFMDIKATLGDVVDQAVNEVAQEAQVMLESATPYDPEPNNGVIPGEEGHLRDSYAVTDATGGIVSTAELTTSEPIKFGYVTGGTDGPIYPRAKRALWWPALQHPVGWVSGQSANPFHQVVAEEVATEGAALIAQIVGEALRQ